ncbi:class II aldolase/adducin family protein [Alphaproteobacteria bacterium]|nr:class II aldolase/adducin family protein [Alphaproteobacteria bacterium]
MALAFEQDYPALQDQVSADEWAIRVDLACLYRLAAFFGWTDSIYTHISARVPGPEDHFLLNPYGFLFEEVTASSLVKIDTDGRPVLDTPFDVNEAGFTIHSAVHMARPDVLCVAHTHTRAGMAVSAQKDGLLPITQNSMMFYGDHLAYHDYEGIALDLDERQRLEADLGQKFVMILRNHGLLVCGRSVGEAFELLHGLEHACDAQIAAQAGGGELILPAADVCAHTADQFWGAPSPEARFGGRAWPAMRRMIDRHNPGYAV